MNNAVALLFCFALSAPVEVLAYFLLSRDAQDLITARHYDPLDRLEREQSDIGAGAGFSAYSHTQRYSLDPNGNRSTTTDAGGVTSVQAFDAHNRITSTSNGEGSTVNTWYPDGTLATITQANGDVSRYDYAPSVSRRSPTAVRARPR